MRDAIFCPLLRSSVRTAYAAPSRSSSFFAVGHGATRDLLGTFRRKLSAFLAKLALPLPPGSNYGFWTQTFANEFAKPKAVFFQGLGEGGGNRTHDI